MKVVLVTPPTPGLSSWTLGFPIPPPAALLLLPLCALPGKVLLALSIWMNTAVPGTQYAPNTYLLKVE